MKKKLRLAIIDSGVSENINFNNNTFCGYSISNNGNRILHDECLDQIGHGTAIVNIISQNIDDIEIDMFKIYYDKFETDEGMFISSLMYISEHNSYDVLHISSGIIQPSNYWDLHNICARIASVGTIIVAAFDNMGAISYPSAFPFVIGVDLSSDKLALNEYEYVENSIVNIRTSSSMHRLKWISSSIILAQGTSYSSAYITLKVLYLLRKKVRGLNNILIELKKDAVRILGSKPYLTYDNSFVSQITKAIVFPFNKEIHSIARYKSEVPFEILGFYDSKYSLNIGKKIYDLDNSILLEDVIQEFNAINWKDDFDTVILGHIEKLCSLSNINYIDIVAENCKKYHKKIFSFDKIDKEFFFYPKVTLDMVPKNRFGKLRCISTPILGVFGTSSKQGKFTLQMMLKLELNKMGYQVGHLSTEPQGALLSADRVYPMGYNSTVEIQGIQAITLLSEYMWEISCSNTYDLIIVGSQSGTLPYSCYNLSYIPMYQRDFIIGTQPDYIVLCVNPHDSCEYIIRTIKYIESLIDTKVIAVVVFPILQENASFGINYKSVKLNDKEMKLVINKVKKETGLKTFALDRKDNIIQLTNEIIKSFAEHEHD